MAESLSPADDDLLDEFLEETREMVAAIRRDRQRLRTDPDDPEIQKRLVDLVHTTKGACGFLPLPRLEALGSAATDFTDALYDGRVPSTPGARLLLVGLLDRMHDLLEAVHRDRHEPPGDDAALIGALGTLLRGGAVPPEPAPAPSPMPAPVPEEVAQAVPETAPEDAAQTAPAPRQPAPAGARPCLVFRAGDGGPFALDLADVRWLDVIEADETGGVPDEAVLRDALTRLVVLGDRAARPAAGAWPVIVLAGRHAVGLVVDEVVDVFADPADAGGAVTFVDPQGYAEA